MTRKLATPTPKPNPPTIIEPDEVQEFITNLRRIRVDAHAEHERLRKDANDRQKAFDREAEQRQKTYERETEERQRDHDNALQDITAAAARQFAIIERCDVALGLDTDRQAPAITERNDR